MIRYFALLTRLQSVTPQRFHDHWRHPHGSYGSAIPGIRSYVQAHHVHTGLLGAGQDDHEAISVLEFDSVVEARGLVTEAQYYDWILPDEPLFMDKSAIESFATQEEVLVPRARTQDGAGYGDSLWYHLDRSTSVQLLQFVRPDGNPDWPEPTTPTSNGASGPCATPDAHPARRARSAIDAMVTTAAGPGLRTAVLCNSLSTAPAGGCARTPSSCRG